MEAEKNKIYVLTVVDRATHGLLSGDAVSERSSLNLQACLERAPQARQYDRDAFPAYDSLYYGAPYEMRSDKKETYSFEATGTQVSLFLPSSGCLAQELAALRSLLQPTSDDEAEISSIQLASH